MTEIPKTITLRGERYTYAGDVPKSEIQKKEQKEFFGARGQKVTFRIDKTDKKVLLVYVTLKRFPQLIEKYGGDKRGWY